MRDRDKEFNALDNDNSDLYVTCNSLIDELNQKDEDMIALQEAHEELKKELEEVKRKLASKKRDYNDYQSSRTDNQF